MGVDFFPCDRCSESICDCGDWVSCNEDCGRRWCRESCAEAEGYEEAYSRDERTCGYCRGEQAEDWQLLDFLCEKLKTTRAKVLARWRKSRRKK